MSACTEPSSTRTRTVVFLRGLGRGRLGVLGFHARVGLCLALLLAAASAVRGITSWSIATGSAGIEPLARTLGWTFIAIGVSATIAIPVISIRRHHDLGRSGWWVLLCFVPIVNVFWTFYVWFFPGQERPNRFGNVPSPATLERALGLAGLTVVAMLMFSYALDMQTSSHRRDADAAHAAAVARTIEDGRTPSQVEVDLTLAYEDGMWRFAAGEDGATPIHGRADFERLYAGEPLNFLASHYTDASMRFGLDGALEGTVVQRDGRRDAVALVWSWRDGMLCHEGTIAQVTVARVCGMASHVPNVGLRIAYPEDSTADQYWLLAQASHDKR